MWPHSSRTNYNFAPTMTPSKDAKENAGPVSEAGPVNDNCRRGGHGGSFGGGKGAESVDQVVLEGTPFFCL